MYQLAAIRKSLDSHGLATLATQYLNDISKFIEEVG
jgi:hypothetical protein